MITTANVESVSTRRERPILFSTPMVQAILEGRKTQTRRIIKLRDGSNPDDESISWNYYEDENGKDIAPKTFDKVMDFSKSFPYWQELKCPYGNVGDELWVRETFHKYDSIPDKIIYSYKADNSLIAGAKIWKPSIHMPRVASRIQLRITDIRVEQLQDISEQDCINEGIEFNEPHNGNGYLHVFKNYTDEKFDMDAIGSFLTLWQKINGSESLASNPFVWVLSFERINQILNEL